METTLKDVEDEAHPERIHHKKLLKTLTLHEKASSTRDLELQLKIEEERGKTEDKRMKIEELKLKAEEEKRKAEEEKRKMKEEDTKQLQIKLRDKELEHKYLLAMRGNGAGREDSSFVNEFLGTKELRSRSKPFEKFVFNTKMEMNDDRKWFKHEDQEIPEARETEANTSQRIMTRAIREGVFDFLEATRKFVDVHNKPILHGENFIPDIVCVDKEVDSISISDIRFIIEIKTPRTINDIKSISQVRSYAKTILKLRAELEVFYCVVCDTLELVVFKFYRRSDDYEESKKYSCALYGSEGCMIMRDMLSIDLDKIEQPSFKKYTSVLEKIIPGSEKYKLHGKLGMGSCGSVFAIGTGFVLKIFSNQNLKAEQNCMREREKIEQVREKLNERERKHLPRVVRDMGDALLLEPQGERNGGAWEDFAQLVSFLEAVHKKARIVHRDIRPSNIVRSGGKFILIDWGCAAELGSEQPHCGTVTTLPDKLYSSIEDPWAFTLLKPEHDLESLVKSFFMMWSHSVITPPFEGASSSETIKRFWDEAELYLEHKSLIEKARKCDYEGIYEALVHKKARFAGW